MTSPDARSAADSLSPALRARLNGARVDPALFADEQNALGRCWTFVGFAHQLRAENDWFTAKLGGRSVFVQRFKQGLAAFENRCAHRGYPLRIGAAGNGPVVCGFHHWRYSHEGVALGVPHCPEMFGVTPRELDARLERVELAQAGEFLFARLAGAEPGPTLEAWLGPALPLLRHVSGWLHRRAGSMECALASHWRAAMDISLDDYHLVAVHPTTFGKNGYMPAEEAFYARFGAHSAYFRGGDEGSLQRLAEGCARGDFLPQRYFIVQLFPTLILSFAKVLDYLGEGYWYLIIQDIVPEAHDRCRTRLRFIRVPQAPTDSALRRALRALAWPSVDLIFRHFARRVHGEDNAACAALQTAARADGPAPRLARHEQRIGWFEETLAAVLQGRPPLT